MSEASPVVKPAAAPAQAPAKVAAPTAKVDEAKRAKRAEHSYMDATGKVVETIEEATACAYKDIATGKSFSFQIPGVKAGAVAAMLATFGLKTLLTNTASGNRNAKDGPKVDDIAAIVDRFGELKDGQWSIAGEGAERGPKWDLTILAGVIADLVKASGGKPQDVSKLLEKLEIDLKYRRGAMANPQVKIAYNKAAGVAGPSVADLAL